MLGRAVTGLAAWAGILVTGLLFGYFVVGPAGHGPSRSVDLSIARAFTHRPFGAAGVSGLLPDALCVIAGVWVAAVLALRWRRHGRRITEDVAALGIAAVGSYALSSLLKVVFARPRPPRALAAIADTGYSFPSSHTTVGVALVVVVTVVLCRHLARRWHGVLWAVGCVLALAIPVSRLVLGVHWMTDVLAGALLGTAWGFATCLLAFRPLRRRRRPPSWARRGVSSAAAVLVLVVLAPVGWSYSKALQYPGSVDVGTRTTDWLRTEGAGSVVDWVENFWYARNPVHAVRASDATHPFRARHRLVRASNQPGPVRVPVSYSTRPGSRPNPVAAAFDGRWVAVARAAGARPALYTAYWRPDPTQPDVAVAGLWIDRTVASPQLVAGTREPGGSGWPWGAEIPPVEQTHVVAAFNGGFRMKDALGGFMINGRVGAPLRDGAASLVIHRDGSATIGRWNIDVHNDPSVLAVRQNLALIVDAGQPVPGLQTNAHGVWGSARNQLQHTWRSALGTDARGNLVYVAGNGLNLQTLADALHQAGAVRGMELDIHNPVVTCNLYQPDPAHPGAVIARKLMPTMQRPATRYLQPDQRDFIAIMIRG